MRVVDDASSMVSTAATPRSGDPRWTPATGQGSGSAQHLSGWSSARTSDPLTGQGANPLAVDHAPSRRPLLATDDVELLDDLLRLAAAAGVEPDVATTPGALRSRWSNHRLVVLGADVAGELSQGFVPRRAGVIVATRAPGANDSVWQRAAALGADRVALLPEGEVWLVDRLAAVGVEGRASAPTIAVLGACGGAGASSLSIALAVGAAQLGRPACTVDLDPVGSGLATLLGADRPVGLSWEELAQTKGRVRGDSLLSALPRFADVAVLGWGDSRVHTLGPGVAGATIDALAQSCDFMSIDLPRTLGDSAAEVVCRSAMVALVVPRRSTAVVSAARLLESEELAGANLQLVVRGPAPVGLEAYRIADSLGIPLLCDIPGDSRVDRRLEQGLPPVGVRGGLRKASTAVLSAVGIAGDSRRR